MIRFRPSLLALLFFLSGCYGTYRAGPGYYGGPAYYGGPRYYGAPRADYYGPPRRTYSSYRGQQTIVFEDPARDQRMHYQHQQRDREWSRQQRRW